MRADAVNPCYRLEAEPGPPDVVEADATEEHRPRRVVLGANEQGERLLDFTDPGDGPEPDIATQFVAAAMTDQALMQMAGNLVGHLFARTNPRAALDAVIEEAMLTNLDPHDFGEGLPFDPDAAKRLALDSLGEAIRHLRDIADAMEG